MGAVDFSDKYQQKNRRIFLPLVDFDMYNVVTKQNENTKINRSVIDKTVKDNKIRS